MRHVSVQEFEQHPAELLQEVESGNRLTLIRGGRPVADLVPHLIDSTSPQLHPWNSEEERLASLAELRATLQRGWDLGGLKITDRDALYDRD